MQLSIDGLKEKGAFTGAPVEKEVKWSQDGEEFTATVFVRKLCYHSAVGDIMAARNGDGVARRIAVCICDDKGEAVFKPEDITGEADPERGPLNDSLTMALLNLIGEVNGLGKKKKASSKS